MFKKLLLSVFVFAGVSQFSFAQKGGIQFIETPWMKAVQKAKAEKKLIFLDAYTSWCGPCKMLQKNVFPDKALGDYYNKNFVSVKVDMERGEGPALSNIYPLNAYPTLFFIDPNTGKTVMQVVGYREAEDLLDAGQKAVKKGLAKK